MTAATTRPRLLDLYCCEGRAAVGYHSAGTVDGGIREVGSVES